MGQAAVRTSIARVINSYDSSLSQEQEGCSVRSCLDRVVGLYLCCGLASLLVAVEPGGMLDKSKEINPSIRIRR